MPERNESAQEKTEQATPQRREEFRKRGDVFQSREVTSVLILAASVLVFYIAGVFIFEQLQDIMKTVFTEAAGFEFTTVNLLALMGKLLKSVGIMFIPVAIGVLVAGVGSSLAQVGVLFSSESFKFDLDRINPVNGLKRLLTPSKLVDVVKQAFKMVIIGGVAYFSIKTEIENAPSLVNVDVPNLIPYLGSAILRLVLETGVLLVVLALFDFLWERQKYEQKIRMTKEELKQDIKEREGDPLVKSRIKSIQRTIASKRMMEAVPTADVIVTNPTHIAVALIYDRDEMPAPKIIAKGAGFVAQKIKEIAREYSVPIVENKPLAQAMYRKLKIGQFIPRELFEATAQVLAYIYRLKKGFRRR